MKSLIASMDRNSPCFQLSVLLIAGFFLSVGFLLIPMLLPQVVLSGPDSENPAILPGSGPMAPVVATPGAPSPQVPRYGVFELTLTATEDYDNPYLQMPGDNTTPGFVVGTFNGPNGDVMEIDGFWDGQKTWKIRIAPTTEGTWTYTTFSTDSGLNGVTGSFTCVPSDSKGFLRVNPGHPKSFMWEDGTPFYWAPTAIMIAHFDEEDRDAQGGGWRVDDGRFQAFLDIRKAQGFNVAHWGYYGFNKKQFNERTQQNEGGAPFLNYDPDRLNPAYHQYGDLRLQAMLNAGIIPQFTLGWPDQGIEDRIGHERLKRYWRYLIARYAAYNITYNLFGELQEFGADYLHVAADYGELTRTWDPYDHLLTSHTVGELEPALANQPWLDYIMLQRSTTETSDYLDYGKPVVNAEYEGYEDAPARHASDADTIRSMMWDIRMREGYFVYESWGNSVQSAGARYSSLANSFFRNRTRFWRLEFNPGLFKEQPGLADPGSEYVIYLPEGGNVSVDLTGTTDTLAVEWYNPRTGEITPSEPAAGGGNQTFNPPFDGDAVLHIGN